MIYYSTDISKSNLVPLEAISLENLSQKLSDNSLNYTIEKLRKVKNIDKTSFNFLKRKLPYFIGATFKNNIRCSENFNQVNFLILDIDAYGDEEKLILLKQLVSEEPSVKLAFISPGGNGLKIVFQLSDPIYSLKEYSDFYQVFSRSFAKQYGLEHCVDFSTSDATRICFLSYDANFYYNNNATNLERGFYMDAMFPFSNEVEDVNSKDTIAATEPGKPLVSKETYSEILKTLKPKSIKKLKKYTVPAPLKELKEMIAANFNKHSLNAISIDEINYGLKIKINDKGAMAIINVYYGKKGFSIVKNQLQNYSEALSDASVLILENLIYTTNSQNNEEEKGSAFKFDDLNSEKENGGLNELKTAR